MGNGCILSKNHYSTYINKIKVQLSQINNTEEKPQSYSFHLWNSDLSEDKLCSLTANKVESALSSHTLPWWWSLELNTRLSCRFMSSLFSDRLRGHRATQHFLQTGCKPLSSGSRYEIISAKLSSERVWGCCRTVWWCFIAACITVIVIKGLEEASGIVHMCEFD